MKSSCVKKRRALELHCGEDLRIDMGCKGKAVEEP